VGRNRVALLVLAAAAPALAASSCTEEYALDPKDIRLEAPADLEARRAACTSGEEAWHADPKRVADLALRRHLDLHAAPWIVERYKASDYEVKERPDWGTYVVRGYTYPSGHVMRYRVKIRPYKDIWYPVEVSRYKIHDLPDDRDPHKHSH
jgi:hypothetical protein